MSGHFAAALTRLEAAIVALPHRLPPEPQTERMLKVLSAAEATPRPPDDEILESVRRRLRLALAGSGKPGNVDPKDLKRAPWILWHGEPPAIGFPGLLDLVFDQALRSPHLAVSDRGMAAGLQGRGAGISSAGVAIQRLLHDSTDARLDSWRKAQGEFRLFETARGPATLAELILSGTQPVPIVLEMAGFREEGRAVSAYLCAVQAELLARIPAALRGPRAPEQTARVCQFLVNGKQLRFDDSRAAIARTLCQPWLDGGRQPDLELQQAIKEFLITFMGNPQLRPGRWVGAESKSALIRRWLARASLKVFFGLIADYAYDKQWKYREAFWLACLEKGAIDDAWLALGASVHASARARDGLDSEFARLEGGGASGDQWVMLLRIGPLVLAEWSHVGALRAWLAQQGPRLGQKSYAPNDLKRPCLKFPPDPMGQVGQRSDASGLWHTGAATGVWQRRAAMLLAQYANIVIKLPDWRLR